MRLLITTDTVGGVWRFTQELAEGLLQAGDSVALVGFGRAASSAQQAECECLAMQSPGRFHYLSVNTPLEWMQDNDRSLQGGAAVLAREAKVFGAELLHTNQFCYGAAELGIPAVVTAHSDVLSWSRASRSGVLEDSAWLRRYVELVQRGLNGADVVTAPTRWTLRALSEHFTWRAESRVIPNGRSIATPGVTRRKLQAVTAGRLWDEAKDLALLAQVRSPIPFIAAGDIECDGARTALLPGVSLRGPLDEQDMLRLFSESAVYICTSKYEPFGLAPLEAALCGCAVVARRIDSLLEVWQDSALYFATAEDLASILHRLYEWPDELRTAQQRAHTQALLYSRERMVERYRALYGSVASTEPAYVA